MTVPVINGRKDGDKDHRCDACGAQLSGHSGGTATCNNRAICAACGAPYGEPDSTNHALEKVPEKDATVTATGNKEYPVLLKQFNQERRFAFARREDILNFVSKNVNVAAVFPKKLSRYLNGEQKNNIVLRPVDGMDLGMTCYLLCPPKNSRLHSEQILIDMIREHIVRDSPV